MSGDIDAFRDAMRCAGIDTDYIPQGTGNIERFHVHGDKSDSKNGWCVLFLDGVPAGSFGNWKTGLSETWYSTPYEKMGRAERDAVRLKMEAAKKEREAEITRLRNTAKQKAAKLWGEAGMVRADHAYLAAKHIKPYGIRQLRDQLTVPVCIDDAMTSLQLIQPDGSKKFLTGGEIKGGYFFIGEPGGTICIAEGYATGCSIHEATGNAVAVAFNANNLEPVARALRIKFPEARLIVCADDDQYTDGNPGLTKAQESAQAVGGLLAVPNFTGCDRTTEPTDFNDLHRLMGADAIKQAIAAAQAVDIPIHQPGADKAAASGHASEEAQNKTSADVLAFRADGGKVIRHYAGRLPDILDALEDCLAASNSNVFVHAGRLVQVTVAKPAAGGAWRPPGALTIHTLDSSHLAVILTRIVAHEKYDARSENNKPCNCPKSVADALLSKGCWPLLPHLSGFVEAPTISLAGRLIDRDGHDAEIGLFLATGNIPGYVAPRKKLTLNDARKAYAELRALVASFPFVAEEDCVGAVSALITAVVRRVLPAAPLFAYTAPAAGTGKTLLSNTAPILSTGKESAVLSLGHDEPEQEKRLAGVFMAGDACINLDNVEGALGGVVLCQACTQSTLRIRPLGGSGVIDVPTNSLLMATGNNLSIVGDLKRRVVLIRLDAQTERPEQRSFAHDHLETVLKQRGKAIAAALTIPLAYLAAGAPAIPDSTPYGSFDGWDRLVRLPLLWLELPDPLKASEALRDQDPDLDAMRLLYAAWMDVLGSKPVSVAEVITAGMSAGHPDISANSELYDALQLVCSEKPNTRRLGYWVRSHRDRIVDGMQLKQAGKDTNSKVMKWTISKL